MKNLKNLGLKALMVMAVVATLGVAASVVVKAAAYEPKSPDGRGRIGIEYIGTKICRLCGSTTAVKCAAAGSSGMVYGLWVSGSSAVYGKGGMAFDSASASGITSLDTQNSYVSSYAISPFVMGTAYVAGTGFNKPGWEPKFAARYESGFVQYIDDVSLCAIAEVRPDTGVNP